ncbi:MAG TPA: hypothetical protein VF188_07240 [Longimicrobiales bacterium]
MASMNDDVVSGGMSAEGEDPESGNVGSNGISRRRFAAYSAMAALGAFWPAGALFAGPRAAKGTVLSEEKVPLEDGGTRWTTVVKLEDLPGTGASTVQNIVMTQRPTEGGDVIEYDITMTPAVATKDGHARVDRIHARYTFVHGPVKGDVREDTLTMSGTVAGVEFKTKTRKVLRPINGDAILPQFSTEQKLQLMLRLAGMRGGEMPHDIPGAIRFLD